MTIHTVGSICSGIEAASVSWMPLGLEFKWFSEIASFPSRVLQKHYPTIPNLGDMMAIPEMLRDEEIEAPDIICGGTPCQAFSLAGLQNGLNDDRGNLTLQFVDIINANDSVREKNGLSKTIVFWENVEGVLTDKTNAFGCFVSSLAGLRKPIENKRWPHAGIIYGESRNVAWRVLDAKYFGLPQQRKRLYVIAGGKDFFPDGILFEEHLQPFKDFPKMSLLFEKEGHQFEVFREYTDCLYAAYGTKWNGNAAATNGSLFVLQDDRLRRLSPLETERLMGFPDNYTFFSDAKKTNRYQATGNSWAVPVVRWLGERMVKSDAVKLNVDIEMMTVFGKAQVIDKSIFIPLMENAVNVGNGLEINCSDMPENTRFGCMRDIISPDAPEDIYISPVGCFGIVRRKNERNTKINARLEEVLLEISSQMSEEEIEKKSRVQQRGRNSNPQSVGRSKPMIAVDSDIIPNTQISFFEASVLLDDKIQ